MAASFVAVVAMVVSIQVTNKEKTTSLLLDNIEALTQTEGGLYECYVYCTFDFRYNCTAYLIWEGRSFICYNARG